MMDVDQFAAFDLMTADAWVQVVARIAPRDRRDVALVSRDMHEIVRGMSLHYDFENAATLDAAVDVAMLACAHSTPQSLRKLTGVRGTHAMPHGAAPWFWTTVLRRLVARQQFLKPGSLMYIDPCSNQWNTIVDKLVNAGPYVTIALCTFVAACHAGIDAIAEWCCGNGGWSGTPGTNQTLITAAHFALLGGGIAALRHVDRCSEFHDRDSWMPTIPLQLENQWLVHMIASRHPRRPSPEDVLRLSDGAQCDAAISAALIGDLGYFSRCVSTWDNRELVARALTTIAPFGCFEATAMLMQKLHAPFAHDELNCLQALPDALSVGDHHFVAFLLHAHPAATNFETELRADDFLSLAIQSHNPQCVRFLLFTGLASLSDEPPAPERVGVSDEMAAEMEAIRQAWIESKKSD